MNRGPVIASTPRTRIELGRTYVYQVRTTDPDGDRLTYRLTAAPAGMTVDAAGLLTWQPLGSQFGQNPVTLEVDDGRGGVAVRASDPRGPAACAAGVGAGDGAAVKGLRNLARRPLGGKMRGWRLAHIRATCTQSFSDPGKPVL